MTAVPSTSNSWLDTILNTGLGAFQTKTAGDTAAAQQKATVAASSSTLKIALIAGGALALIVVLVLVFRK